MPHNLSALYVPGQWLPALVQVHFCTPTLMVLAECNFSTFNYLFCDIVSQGGRRNSLLQNVVRIHVLAM